LTTYTYFQIDFTFDFKLIVIILRCSWAGFKNNTQGGRVIERLF